jgi:hypothetical protein
MDNVSDEKKKMNYVESKMEDLVENPDVKAFLLRCPKDRKLFWIRERMRELEAEFDEKKKGF